MPDEPTGELLTEGEREGAFTLADVLTLTASVSAAQYERDEARAQASHFADNLAFMVADRDAERARAENAEAMYADARRRISELERAVDYYRSAWRDECSDERERERGELIEAKLLAVARADTLAGQVAELCGLLSRLIANPRWLSIGADHNVAEVRISRKDYEGIRAALAATADAGGKVGAVLEAAKAYRHLNRPTGENEEDGFDYWPWKVTEARRNLFAAVDALEGAGKGEGHGSA